MKPKYVAFFSFAGAMMLLGLFVNNLFFLLGMVGLCGGHMLLGHGHGNEHARETTVAEDEMKTHAGCH